MESNFYTMKINFKLKFIHDNLAIIEQKKQFLSVWEKEFYQSIKGLDPNKLTQSQRNVLNEIGERLKR